MLGFGVLEAFLISNSVAIAVSATTAAIIVVFKDFYDSSSLKGSDSDIMFSIKHDMKKPVELVDFENDAVQGVLVENKDLQEALFEMLTTARKQGGLYIIGSPAHTGKSVYLQEALNAYKNESSYCTYRGDIKYMKAIPFGFEKLTMEYVKASLGIPSDKQMKDFLPAGSLIIIDQFDLPTLSEEHAYFFRKLATNSFNCKKYAVIVNVSNATPFKEMMELNQGQKIFPACDPRLFQFDENMMKQYIVRLDPHCSDVDDCVRKALPYKSIGVLKNILMNSKRKNGFDISSHATVDWANFEEVYDMHK